MDVYAERPRTHHFAQHLCQLVSGTTATRWQVAGSISRIGAAKRCRRLAGSCWEAGQKLTGSGRQLAGSWRGAGHSPVHGGRRHAGIERRAVIVAKGQHLEVLRGALRQEHQRVRDGTVLRVWGGEKGVVWVKECRAVPGGPARCAASGPRRAHLRCNAEGLQVWVHRGGGKLGVGGTRARQRHAGAGAPTPVTGTHACPASSGVDPSSCCTAPLAMLPLSNSFPNGQIALRIDTVGTS